MVKELFTPEFDARVQAAVSAKLKTMRIAAGLTVTEVAVQARTFRPIVCRIERGIHMPSLDTCKRFAEACGGTLVDVFDAIDVVIQDVRKEVRDGAFSETGDVQGVCRDCGQRLPASSDD